MRTQSPRWSSAMEIKPLPYPTMTIEEIQSLPIESLADEDAHLYLWTINKYVEQSYAVARAWGFTPTQLLVWCKRPMGLGLGGTFVSTAEYILFCRRGHLKANQRIDSSWWIWKRGKHSQKPDDFQAMVEHVSHGPYLELFARRKRPGWDVWGNEVESDIQLIS